jgi:DNA-binding NarL/FixJ family response regulator
VEAMMMQTNKQNCTTSLIVIESNPFFRQGIETYFSDLPDFRVIAVSDSITEGIELCHVKQPDFVLFDLTLLTNRTAETGRYLAKFRKVSPSTRIVIWGDAENLSIVADIMLAGPDGYLSRKQPMTDLLYILNQLRDGRTLFYIQQSLDGIATYIGTRLTQVDAPMPSLTRREQQVLQFLRQGHSNTMIAERMGVKYTTVGACVSRILTKLEVDNRVQAVIRADELGLLPIPKADQLSLSANL